MKLVREIAPIAVGFVLFLALAVFMLSNGYFP